MISRHREPLRLLVAEFDVFDSKMEQFLLAQLFGHVLVRIAHSPRHLGYAIVKRRPIKAFIHTVFLFPINRWSLEGNKCLLRVVLNDARAESAAVDFLSVPFFNNAPLPLPSDLFLGHIESILDLLLHRPSLHRAIL
jgi:hypothetical protein